MNAYEIERARQETRQEARKKALETLVPLAGECGVPMRTVEQFVRDFSRKEVEDGLLLLREAMRVQEIYAPSGWLKKAILCHYQTRRSQVTEPVVSEEERRARIARAEALVAKREAAYKRLDEAAWEERRKSQRPLTQNPFFAMIPKAVQERLLEKSV